MTKRLLISIDEELWNAILAEAGGDDGIESFFEDWETRYKVIREEETSNIMPLICDGCGYVIHPGHGRKAPCGDGWFHNEVVGDFADSCYDMHNQNCSLCPIDL